MFKASQTNDTCATALVAELKRLFGLRLGSAGQQSLVGMLRQAGFTVSRWLVRKLMKQEGLVSRQRLRHRYAKAEKAHTLIPNVLGRQFQPHEPNQVWCDDTDYIHRYYNGLRPH